MQPDLDHGSPGPDLLHYVAIVRRWIPLILVAGVIGATLMATNALRQDEVFEAVTEVIVSQPPALDFSFVERPLSNTAERRLENEVELIESSGIREAIVAAGGPNLAVRANEKGDSDVIVVQARGAAPATVSDDLNRFVADYIDVRRRQQLDEFDAAAERIGAEQRAAAEQLIELSAPLTELNAQIAGTPPGDAQSALVLERDRVSAEISDQRSNLRNRVDEYENFLIQVEGAVEQTDGGLQVITEARPPAEPISPTPKRDAVLGLSAGVLMGLLLVLVIDYVDDRIRRVEDLERALPSEIVFGQIPSLRALQSTPVLDPDAAGRGGKQDVGAGVEAYRSLAASLEFANLEASPSIIQLTSPVASEGKSTTTANLAAAFCSTGIRVAVVDTDLRRPSIHRLFDLDNDVGLSSLVVGQSDLDETVQTPAGIPGLSVICAGPPTPDATKVLHAEETEKLIHRLAQDHDLVLIDSTPILPLADGLIVAQIADLTVMVARAKKSRRRALRKARTAITNVNGPPVVLVLNDAPRSGVGVDDYYGSYASTEDTSAAVAVGAGPPKRSGFSNRRRRNSEG